MANKYGKAFFTNNATVTWSHLHKPDVKFGNPNYNITVALTPELESAIKDAAQAAGFGKISKVNGVGNREDGKVVGQELPSMPRRCHWRLPCVDANAKPTKAVPFGGDVVRLASSCRSLLERDNSMSIYLDGCQIIEKTEREEGTGGGVVDGGFDGANAEAPEVKENIESEAVAAEDADTDLPFWLKSVHRVNYKPLSMNEAFMGRRRRLPSIETTRSKYPGLILTCPAGASWAPAAGCLSNRAADLDNVVKPFLDILQSHYGFNDNRIYIIEMTKVKVPKTEEYIAFDLYPLDEEPATLRLYLFRRTTMKTIVT